MTTMKQTLANRLNAQRSTGPRTVSGKQKSRRSALKHGCTGAGIVHSEGDDARIADRRAIFTEGLRPAGRYEHWLVELAAIASVKLDNCREVEADLRVVDVHRAEDFWDEDQVRHAAEMANQLLRDPARASLDLRESHTGCELMLGRWERLGGALEASGEWDEPQRQMVLDLLGVPAEVREARLTELDGPTGDALREVCEAIVVREIETLWPLSDSEKLADREELERDRAEQGKRLLDGREARLMARYAAAASRRMTWAINVIKQRRDARQAELKDSRRIVEETFREQAREQRHAKQQDNVRKRYETTMAHAADLMASTGPVTDGSEATVPPVAAASTEPEPKAASTPAPSRNGGFPAETDFDFAMFPSSFSEPPLTERAIVGSRAPREAISTPPARGQNGSLPAPAQHERPSGRQDKKHKTPKRLFHQKDQDATRQEIERKRAQAIRNLERQMAMG